jgi:hypothetical protein
MVQSDGKKVPTGSYPGSSQRLMYILPHMASAHGQRPGVEKVYVIA